MYFVCKPRRERGCKKRCVCARGARALHTFILFTRQKFAFHLRARAICLSTGDNKKGRRGYIYIRRCAANWIIQNR
jgi:hypothetical protein